MTTPVRRRLPPPTRGAAALVVVMVLFFILSLVAAYSSRNLIFEQRTSANYYRATKAFEAAEAGLEWALAQLNGGRIDSACVTPSPADPTASTFRERYLEIDPATGVIGVRPQAGDGPGPRLIRAACVRGAADWECSCPSDGSAPALAAPAGVIATSTFLVSFEEVGARPGLVRVVAQGCSNFDATCLIGAPSGADANAEVSALVALAPALTQAPLASLTVRGELVPDNAQFLATHPDAVAVNSGGSAHDPDIVMPPGTPSFDVGARLRLVSDNDLTLAAITPEGGLGAGERMFLGLFGVAPAAYRLQPAVIRVSCTDNCAAVLGAAAAANPGRVLWVDGDLSLGAADDLTLGSPGAPVVLVIDGNLQLASGSRAAMHGLMHLRGGSLLADAGADVTFIGAVVAEGEDGGVNDGLLTIQGEPRFVYDIDLVQHAQDLVARRALDFGSFARVPGSWRDFR